MYLQESNPRNFAPMIGEFVEYSDPLKATHRAQHCLRFTVKADGTKPLLPWFFITREEIFGLNAAAFVQHSRNSCGMWMTSVHYLEKADKRNPCELDEPVSLWSPAHIIK
ncbi:hypothetical protein L484_001323 [Morus notabilis]|uniref:Uncharacterized protein n=1 Tax=Morus notabilis TaxID=981085 RepID=W9QZX8_9ROSA|nr:hypothetical protein L484_001323 [Morus notabilis]